MCGSSLRPQAAPLYKVHWCVGPDTPSGPSSSADPTTHGMPLCVACRGAFKGIVFAFAADLEVHFLSARCKSRKWLKEVQQVAPSELQVRETSRGPLYVTERRGRGGCPCKSIVHFQSAVLLLQSRPRHDVQPRHHTWLDGVIGFSTGIVALHSNGRPGREPTHYSHTRA